ncbi:hypothetical protein IW262DRAFT_1347744 [Armillaria fumosa]|nr:hypothetical protein IW262DRAFT_1347744 [Armillaria fumosa]
MLRTGALTTATTPQIFLLIFVGCAVSMPYAMLPSQTFYDTGDSRSPSFAPSVKRCLSPASILHFNIRWTGNNRSDSRSEPIADVLTHPVEHHLLVGSETERKKGKRWLAERVIREKARVKWPNNGAM